MIAEGDLPSDDAVSAGAPPARQLRFHGIRRLEIEAFARRQRLRKEVTCLVRVDQFLGNGAGIDSHAYFASATMKKVILRMARV